MVEKIYYSKQRKTLKSFLGHITNLAKRATLVEEDIHVENRKALEDVKAKVEASLETEKDEDRIALLKHIGRHVKYALEGNGEKNKVEPKKAKDVVIENKLNGKKAVLQTKGKIKIVKAIK